MTSQSRLDRSPYQPGRIIYGHFRPGPYRYTVIAISANQNSVVARSEKQVGGEWMPQTEIVFIPTHRIGFGLDDESVVEPGPWIHIFPGVVAAKGKAPYSPPRIVEEGELDENTKQNLPDCLPC